MFEKIKLSEILSLNLAIANNIEAIIRLSVQLKLSYLIPKGTLK